MSTNKKKTSRRICYLRLKDLERGRKLLYNNSFTITNTKEKTGLLYSHYRGQVGSLDLYPNIPVPTRVAGVREGGTAGTKTVIPGLASLLPSEWYQWKPYGDL